MLTVKYITQESRASDRDVIYIHYFNNPHNFSAGKVSSNYFSDFSLKQKQRERNLYKFLSIDRKLYF